MSLRDQKFDMMFLLTLHLKYIFRWSFHSITLPQILYQWLLCNA